MEAVKRDITMMRYKEPDNFVLDLSTGVKPVSERNPSPHHPPSPHQISPHYISSPQHHGSPNHSSPPPSFHSPLRESSPHVDTTTYHNNTSPISNNRNHESNCLPHRSPIYEHHSGKISPVCEADSGYSLSPRSYKGESDGSMSPPPLVQRVLDASSSAFRPFKAYPRNPLALGHDEAFLQFREQMLSKVRSLNKSSNPSKARLQNGNIGDDKDAAYWERRRKNNAAAKRSRDARRAKEDEIAIRAAFLEQENLKLKYEIASLKDETCKLRAMVNFNNPTELLHIPQVHALHPINHLQRI